MIPQFGPHTGVSKDEGGIQALEGGLSRRRGDPWTGGTFYNGIKKQQAGLGYHWRSV
jgi:hypothetical protein